MGENDFRVILQAVLDESGISKDLKDIQSFLDKNILNIAAQIDTSNLKNNLQKVSKELTQSLNVKFGSNLSETEVFKILNRELQQTSSNSRKLVSDLARLTKANTMQKWLDNNSKAAKQYGTQIQDIIAKMRDLGTTMNKADFDNAVKEFKNVESAARQTGNLGKTSIDKLKDTWQKFGGWTLGAQSLMFFVDNLRKAVEELKEVDTLLTEISKANDELSKSELEGIGTRSFSVASRYGRKSTDYLSGVQEASRAGYDNAEDIAELSVAIQGAGDVTADIANQYVIATDKAYQLGGNVEALTKVFDGSNKITKMVLLYRNI